MKKLITLLLIAFSFAASAQTDVTYTRHQNIDDLRWTSPDVSATFDIMADFSKDGEPNGEIVYHDWTYQGGGGIIQIFPFYTGHLKKKPSEYWVRISPDGEWIQADRVPIKTVR